MIPYGRSTCAWCKSASALVLDSGGMAVVSGCGWRECGVDLEASVAGGRQCSEQRVTTCKL